jgi:hypothetical protein
MLILVVAAAFFVQTYIPNPIAQQIREQTQFFDQDRRNLGYIALDMTLSNNAVYIYSRNTQIIEVFTYLVQLSSHGLHWG